MLPALRRPVRRGAATRPRRAARAGFTLVEMLISVALVLLMMLMFAEIYTLAQQTITTQRGIAENDQKARILTEVLRRDLDTRTFRSIYPFKLSAVQTTIGGMPVLRPDRSFATATPAGQELIEKRRGYFSYSENTPVVDTDDTLQLTISVDQTRFGRPGDRIYGKAVPFGTPLEDGPEFDDGVLDNGTAASGAAEVSYFLRGGNLYRSVLLVRKPYFDLSKRDNTDASPNGFPPTRPQFWNEFDFSAYRWPDGAGGYTPRFHGPGSLNNNTDSDTTVGSYLVGPPNLYVPQLLSTPHLRFGHISGDNANPLNCIPLEYISSGDFIGRFLVSERAHANFAFPGTGWAPFDNATALNNSTAPFLEVDQYQNGPRRGVDLMLTNVHSFDIKVWDEIVGDFVDLGHDLTGTNPYTKNPGEPGFYSAVRRRLPIPLATLDPATQNGLYDHPNAIDYGNRYDTWSPLMYVASSADFDTNPATQIWRTGRTPYRPQQTNPDPNTAAYNDPASGMPGREPAMTFGTNQINVDVDGNGSLLDGNPAASDGEVPLRAIRITVRYLDVNSGQTRQATMEHSLVD